MKSYIFTCKTCSTKLSIETELPDDKIHMVPPCPCGVSRMDLQAGKKTGVWDE